MRNIALIGKARSGKDSAAAHLVATRSYTRLAFADPLKEMALRVNPIISTYTDMWGGHGDGYERLADLVSAVGWERAKDNYPEVRRILQHMGQAQREFDEDYWVNALRRKLNAAESWNLPVVVTDVRYPNEALMLRARGFRLVRVTRGVPEIPHGQHESETALDDFAADFEISNSGTLADLHRHIETLI